MLMCGATTAFIANAASFAVSAALLARLPAGPRTPRPPVWVTDLLAGYIDIVRAYPRVTAICLASGAGCVPGYFFMSSAVVYATHLGQPPTFLTVLFGALAVGGFLGGVWSKQSLVGSGSWRRLGCDTWQAPLRSWKLAAPPGACSPHRAMSAVLITCRQRVSGAPS